MRDVTVKATIRKSQRTDLVWLDFHGAGAPVNILLCCRRWTLVFHPPQDRVSVRRLAEIKARRQAGAAWCVFPLACSQNINLIKAR